MQFFKKMRTLRVILTNIRIIILVNAIIAANSTVRGGGGGGGEGWALEGLIFARSPSKF